MKVLTLDAVLILVLFVLTTQGSDHSDAIAFPSHHGLSSSVREPTPIMIDSGGSSGSSSMHIATVTMHASNAVVGNSSAHVMTSTASSASSSSLPSVTINNSTTVLIPSPIVTSSSRLLTISPSASSNHTSSMHLHTSSASGNYSTAMTPSTTVLHTSSASGNDSSATTSPTAILPSASSTAVLPSSSVVTPTQAPVIKYECGNECKSLKRRVYAAAGFAVVLGIVCVALSVLLWRQYRITRDSGDPALSRLI